MAGGLELPSTLPSPSRPRRKSLEFVIPAMTSAEEINLGTNQPVLPVKTAAEEVCVLLAEDDPALKRYLQIVLERAGYNVVSAADGLEAMKLLLSNPVDVVVTDAVMPNLNGYELSRFVRCTQHLAHLPIILLSALDPKNTEADQVDAFLPKPVSPEVLLDCLKVLMAVLK